PPPPRRPCRGLRRALPARARRPGRRRRAGGRPRRGPPPVQLPRGVERATPLTHDNRRRPAPPPRGRIMLRRLIALVVVGAIVAGVAWVGVTVAQALHGTTKAKLATTQTAVVPRPFRVIFPEGFTRRQMAQRVEAVA